MRRRARAPKKSLQSPAGFFDRLSPSCGIDTSHHPAMTAQRTKSLRIDIDLELEALLSGPAASHSRK
jgi:hypothetical protein